jgi:hypothetical protein
MSAAIILLFYDVDDHDDDDDDDDDDDNAVSHEGNARLRVCVVADMSCFSSHKQRANSFKMTEFLGSNARKNVFLFHILDLYL